MDSTAKQTESTADTPRTPGAATQLAVAVAAAAALESTIGGAPVFQGKPNMRKRQVPTQARRRAITKSAGGRRTFTGNWQGLPWRFKARRNEPCPCGSAQKFKRCCHGTV